jgi:hypothetical protein
MEVEDALQVVLGEVEVLLADAEDRLRRLEEDVAGLQAERYGLQLALARRRGGTRPPPPLPVLPGDGTVEPGWEPVSWQELSRAEAVYQLLLEENGPLARGTIAERLAEVGRLGDDPDSVSAALAYLRRTGRAERTGLGQWVAAVPPPL